jgi:CRISPR locus-related DNA-binding protein
MVSGRIFICSFGFDEKFVLRCLVRYGFSTGDIVKLITSDPPDSRVLDSYRRVEELARRLGGASELLAINCRNLDEAISAIIDIIRSLREHEIIVNLSGGMRILICLILIALMVTEIKSKIRIEMETEDLKSLIDIPQKVLKLPRFRMGGVKFKIAEILILRGELSVTELAVVVGKDKSLVSRHIRDMEEVGLIHTERKGRTKIVRPTSILKAITKC